MRQYDALGRTIAVIENYSDGVATNETPDKDRTTEYTYDPNSRLAIVTAKAQNANDDQKTYYLFWNTDNGTTKSNVSNGSMVTAVVYPDSGEQTHVALTDGLWVLTPTGTDYVAYAYDRLGRKTGVTDQRQVVHTYAYSETTGALLTDTVTFPGTLPASLDNTIKKIGYTYDDFGRIDKVASYSDTGSTKANEVAFEYGPWGVVTKSMQDHDAAATATDPNVQYAYEDGSGGADVDANFVRVDSVTYPGPSTRRVVYFNYPTSGVGAALSRLGEIADDHGDQGGRTRYASYTFLGAGTMVDANYPAGPAPLGTGIPALTYGSRANSYSGLDRFGRVVDQKWQNQSGTPTVNDRFRYAYDRASNRTSRDPAADSHTPPDANDNYYTYDGLDRLVKSNWGTLDGSGVITDQNADANQAWSLDPVGNWSQFKWDDDGGGAGDPTVQARTHNTANEIQAISGTGANWVDPTYDAAGNMSAGPQPRFETVDANTQLYKYDAWNRLTKIYQDANCNDTIDDPSELVATYSYDGLNRRIRKVVEAGENDITYDYYYNESWQVLEVRKGADPDAYQQYVWGANYIDAPVVSFLDGNLDGDVADQGDSTLYYTYDGNFNVTALVKADGTVAERYTYDPYGQVTFKAANWSDAASQAKSAYDNEILYCGYRFDPESGNYLVRLRYLTPPLGRWLTNDPIRYADGMNRYQYVGGSPLRHVDYLGLAEVDADQLKAVMEKRGQWVTLSGRSMMGPISGGIEYWWKLDVMCNANNTLVIGASGLTVTDSNLRGALDTIAGGPSAEITLSRLKLGAGIELEFANFVELNAASTITPVTATNGWTGMSIDVDAQFDWVTELRTVTTLSIGIPLINSTRVQWRKINESDPLKFTVSCMCRTATTAATTGQK